MRSDRDDQALLRWIDDVRRVRRAARGVPEVSLREVPAGFAGTREIVAEMSRLARGALQDEHVNQLARLVTRPLAPNDTRGEVAGLLGFLQRNWRYTGLPFDPDGFQRAQTAPYTLFDSPVRTGECASLSVALAALFLSLGHEVQWRTAGMSALAPLDFCHVYVIVLPRNDVAWLAADPSFDGPLGWEHPSGVVQRDWSLGAG